jgi:predicted small lipoprotein YifL
MSNTLPLAILLLALAGCQSATTPTANAPTAATPSAISMPTGTPAPTTEAARAAVARYLQGQPNAALYVPDSASIVDVDAHWQVLVPRTDWAKRMPNKAAFEVDKATGAVRTLPVK